MANEISLVTASGRTVTPKDDGIIYEVFSPGNGIIYGGAVTINDSSTLHITAGHGIVCGRKFTIDDSDIPVALSGSGSLLGRLYIHLDLADAADPITLLVETGESLTPVVQDADVNINNGVFEINLATFDVDTVTISNLVNLDVTVAPMGDMEGATSALDGKGGYVPAPQAGDEDKVLKGDGTWGEVAASANIRYNDTDNTIEAYVNGNWEVIISNVYAGEYKGVIGYCESSSSQANTRIKLLYIRAKVENGSMVYSAIDYADSGLGDGSSIRNGYGIADNTTISVVGNGNFNINVAVGAHYAVPNNIASGSTNEQIISSALPKTVASMLVGDGSAVYSSSGSARISYVILNG